MLSICQSRREPEVSPTSRPRPRHRGGGLFIEDFGNYVRETAASRSCHGRKSRATGRVFGTSWSERPLSASLCSRSLYRPVRTRVYGAAPRAMVDGSRTKAVLLISIRVGQVIDWSKWRDAGQRGGARVLSNDSFLGTSLEPELEKCAVVIGAGFSRAISTAMPVTDVLGSSVRARLPIADRSNVPAAFSDGSFEQWLSYLAEEQPHLSQSENLQARALMYKVVEATEDILGEDQRKALEKAVPEWLSKLLSILHVDKVDVVTLNYDNLFECAISSYYLPTYDHSPPFRRRPADEDDILRRCRPVLRLLVTENAARTRSAY